MSNLNKLFIVVIVFLFALAIFELVYFTSSGKKAQPDSIETYWLTPEDEAILNDPYYNQMFKYSFDPQKNRIYMNIEPKTFFDWRKNMGPDLNALYSISTYRKGQVSGPITLTDKLVGTISKLDTNRMNGSERFLYFVLVGKNGDKSMFSYNEGSLEKATFAKLVNGRTQPLDWKTELKDGDTISIEEKLDLSKPPRDSGYTIEFKFTKL